MRRVSLAGTPTFMSRRNALNRTRAPTSRKTRAKTRSACSHAGRSVVAVNVHRRTASDGKGQMQALQHQNTEQMRSDGEFRGCGGERQGCTSVVTRMRPQVCLTSAVRFDNRALRKKVSEMDDAQNCQPCVHSPGSPTFIRGGLSPLRNASQLGLHQKPS